MFKIRRKEKVDPYQKLYFEEVEKLEQVRHEYEMKIIELQGDNDILRSHIDHLNSVIKIHKMTERFIADGVISPETLKEQLEKKKNEDCSL